MPNQNSEQIGTVTKVENEEPRTVSKEVVVKRKEALMTKLGQLPRFGVEL